VNAEDGDLGEVDDGRGEEAALRAERGDRERGTLEVLELRLAGARLAREAVDLAPELEDVLLVCVLHDRDDEATFGRGRDADVVVAPEDQLVRRFVERRVEHRMLLERGGDRLRDEREER